MYSRNQPVPVATHFEDAWWATLGRSGAWIVDGQEQVTEFRPAGEIFPGLSSRRRVLSKSEAAHRAKRNKIAAWSRRQNRSR